MTTFGEKDVLARFGENVWWLRTQHRYSQEHLAFLAGIHRTQISSFETGSRAPLLLTLVSLAGALEVSADRLLEGISYSPPINGTGGFLVESLELPDVGGRPR
jgi:transcriptional regulator with XRE-family HTH domain